VKLALIKNIRLRRMTEGFKEGDIIMSATASLGLVILSIKEIMNFAEIDQDSEIHGIKDLNTKFP
jgi:hypothetical protein